MKKYIGKMVEFVVDGFPMPFRAKVVGDLKDRVLVLGEKDKFPRHIVKSKVCSFMPLEAVPDDSVNLLVLYCENSSIKCDGVQCVKEGEGFNQSDFAMFMSPCPARRGTCHCGSKGELRGVDGKLLTKMFAGTMFGDYPEKESE